MTKLNFIFALLLSFSIGLSAQSYQDKKGKKQLWGAVSIEDLKQEDFKEWYDKNYADYKTTLSKKDAAHLENVEVKIYIGTWCGDTKYLVPKFIKTWESMALPYSKLKFIAVHNEEKLYKQGPKGETEGMNIHKVPTFIFEKEGKEIGRIVERTVFDLDTDIMVIAKGEAYQERYKGVSILNDLFKEVDKDSLNTKAVINSTYKKIRREVSSPSELNSYGYVLLAEQRIKEAFLVFKLNRFIFPFDPNARDSFAEALYRDGDLAQAKINYLESFRINPKNNKAIEQLALINEEINKAKEEEKKKEKANS